MEKPKKVRLIDDEDLKVLLNFTHFIKENIEQGNLTLALDGLNMFGKIIVRNFKEED